MSSILQKAVRKAILKKMLIIGSKERESLRKRAQNTPYLDKMLAKVNKK